MQNKQIVFTKKDTAELLDVPFISPLENQVVVKTVFSTISPGTERANITGDPNISPTKTSCVKFPRTCGYSSSGVVVAKGDNTDGISIGDRVAVFHSTHSKYNTVSKNHIVKIKNDNISFEEAALSFIATFSLAAIRKTNLEIGESAIVMGLGLLGQIAVKLLKAAGAVPIIAVDPVESRRNEALASGADFAFDPFEEDFAENVKNVTDGGVNVAIEVTGAGSGLDKVLDCMARFGRVALLGCTRDNDFSIDYYRKVHYPGITLIGAHTNARPKEESHHGYFTHADDIKAVLKLATLGRLDLISLVKETYSPDCCKEVYSRLVSDKEFPVTVHVECCLLLCRKDLIEE